VVFSAGAVGTRIMPLDAGRIELGRTDGSPGQLDDGRVSRSHALVERDGERWMVTDLGSQNGTFVDGERILPRAPTPVARAAHALVAVNCAAIPEGLAERLLFGARRGAYSGIEADAAGYLQEADGGTLFLDEIAELDLPVQAKLLRVLESHEVLPLGASKPRKVDFALCSATSKDLRALIAMGSFREDLYFRVGH